MISWKVCTKDTRVCANHNRIRLVRHGDSSEDIDVQLRKLKTMVKSSKDQQLRLRNCNARHRKIGTGAVVKNRKGLRGVEGGKVLVISGKKKANVRRETSAISDIKSNDRAQKTTPNAATPSEPSMTRGRSVSRKRSMRGKSNPGIFLRQPCRYYLKGTCTRSPWEY